MNRARPMAARLKKKNKPRVDYEPRSAHGRAVNNSKPRVEHEPRSAHGRAVNKLFTLNVTCECCQNLKSVYLIYLSLFLERLQIHFSVTY